MLFITLVWYEHPNVFLHLNLCKKGLNMTKPKSYPVTPGWQLILRDLGVEPRDVLRRAHLSEDLLKQEKASLTTAELFRFWRSIEAEINDPLFPLRLASVVTTEAFSPPLFAIICSENLLTASKRLSSYKRLVGPMELHVSEHEDELELQLEWIDTSEEPPVSLVIGELLFLLQLARLSTRENIKPLAISTPKLPSEMQAYEEFIGVLIKEGKAHTITYSMEDARLPFLTANQGMWKIFEPTLRKELAKLDASHTTSEKVKAVLLKALPSGACSIDDVSRKLALGKRTLQRRLSSEQTSFQVVLDQTRLELAQHYLTTTSISSTEISFLLGFEEPNSFYRAFQSWTGKTPEQIRRTYPQ